MSVFLSEYRNPLHQPAGIFKKLMWYYVNLIFFKSGLFPINALKIFLLKLFGAKIGKHVIIKPIVNIKYPWNLTLGNHIWIGEDVWIDNLVAVHIGNHVCISQGALLISGNHDFNKRSFDLMALPILIDDGVWVCAKAIVHGGSHLCTNAVLLSGSSIKGVLEENSVNLGNPAIKIKERTFTD